VRDDVRTAPAASDVFDAELADRGEFEGVESAALVISAER
jgi:hypothetical protein